MPSKKSKKSSNEKKIDDQVKRLIRQRLYPEINADKENMDSSSSGDSPEKFSNSHSPTMPRKSNSSSSTDSMLNTPDSPKRRSGRLQPNQMNNFQDRENSDVDMETDKFVDTNYLRDQEQEKSEFSPDVRFKNHFSPKSDRRDNFIDARKRRSIQPESLNWASQRTEPSASTSNTSHSSLENSKYLILFCIIIFFCILILFIQVFWTRYPDTPYMNDQFDASTLVKSLKSEFKDNPPLTFRIIHSALRNVLEVEPTAPAIILLLATNGSETVCSEFARRLVDSLSVPKYTVKIFGNDYRQANTNNAKMKIDNAISNTLKDDQLGSVLIHDLDQIPGQAAMILHKYCDHENAPFKKAVFVMTVNYNKAITDYFDTSVWDKAVNDHLLGVWTDIGVDQATPLLARLTVSVAVITA